MSRSYKKNPVLKDGSRGRHKSGKTSMKTIANRKIRRKPIEELPIREKGAYRKVCESWDISDWSFRQTKEEAIKQYEKYQKEAEGGPRYEKRVFYRYVPETGEFEKHIYTAFTNHYAIEMITEFPTLEDYLIDWYKSYKRK